MKAPEFDRNKARWDHYRAFHIEYASRYNWMSGNGQIVHFDTGEMIFFSGLDHVDLRRKYSDLNIAIIGTTDKGFPKVTLPDGFLLQGSNKLPLAWLNDGGLYNCLWDHASGRLYNISTTYQSNKDMLKQLPARFQEKRNIVAYHNGSEGHVLCAPFELSVPADKEDRDTLAGIKIACKAWLKMRELDLNAQPLKDYYNTHQGKLDPRWVIRTGFADLSDQQRLHIINGRVSDLRKNVTVPYIQTSEEK